MTIAATSSPNFPSSVPISSLPNVANSTVKEASLAEKIAVSTIGTAIQIPINFGVIYGSLYTMEKSLQLTSAIVGGVYSTFSSALGSAYCAVAKCSTDPINTAIAVVLNSTEATTSTESATNASSSQRWMTKGDISMFVAIAVPIRPIASYCFKQLLGCKEDTPVRNAAAIVATSLTTTALSSYAANMLGFETDTERLIQHNIIGLVLAPALMYTSTKMKQMIEEDEQLLAAQNNLQTVEDADYLEDVDSINIEVTGRISLESSRVKHLSDASLLKVEEIKQNVLEASISA